MITRKEIASFESENISQRIVNFVKFVLWKFPQTELNIAKDSVILQSPISTNYEHLQSHNPNLTQI